ncbi:TraX family protein [Bifidobacterium eulemuris]|uniref:ABC transporter permease n=1 Tax=Bifidobacterium eulemuris TaxID=1765219 RepID=A0A261G2G9_9BIFI|nr:TraX family protein [Bifidobacterium eulemuris]OZG65631.1 ABC transporter permease [Bifidobacterium eulemuris]QOL32401.1 ABC transporter permease [Bifidobacterium eulemuris]
MNQQQAAHPARGLSYLRLKIVGIVLVALSCVGGVVFPTGLSGLDAADVDMTNLTVAVLCEAVSWVAVPVYAWLTVEGYRHTRDVRWYAVRLLALAVISEVPYDLATTGKAVDWGSQNPVFALAIVVVALALIDAFRDRPAVTRRAVGVVVAVAALAWMLLGHIGLRQQIMNEGVLIVVLALIFRYLSARENTMMMLAAACSALFCILPAFGVAILHYRNGRLGYDRANKPWVQWLFYALYPAVLLVFAAF